MYAILGATGNTGSIAARRLLEAGQPVRALVRSRDRARDLSERGAEVVEVDVDDAASLRDGLEGATGAYFLLPPAMQSEDFLGSRRIVAERLVEAARVAKIEHVVLLSSIGAQHATGTGVIRTLHHFERALADAGIPTTAVRAAYFMENWASVIPAAKSDGVLPQMLGAKDRAIPMVSVADIGVAAADALAAGAEAAGVIELEGPARYAPKDAAAAFAAELGRPVEAVDVPFEKQEAVLQSFGISADVAALFCEMNEGIFAGRVDFEDGTARRVRGDVTLRDALRRLL